MVFGTPTKVLSEAGPAAEFMGANKVPDFQRFFQVRLPSPQRGAYLRCEGRQEVTDGNTHHPWLRDRPDDIISWL